MSRCLDPQTPPEVRPLGASFTPPENVFGGFWKTREIAETNSKFALEFRFLMFHLRYAGFGHGWFEDYPASFWDGLLLERNPVSFREVI